MEASFATYEDHEDHESGHAERRGRVTCSAMSALLFALLACCSASARPATACLVSFFKASASILSSSSLARVKVRARVRVHFEFEFLGEGCLSDKEGFPQCLSLPKIKN